MTRSTFRAATNPAGATRLSATSETSPMTARPCPSQRIRSGTGEHRHDGEGHRQGCDRHQDVQPELRPAVRILVEPQPDRRGHEHDPGQRR